MDDDMSTPKAAVEPKPGRRRLLKALAGAGGVFATGALLPERWTRPVVESIIVPAHAQATGVLAQSYAGSNFAPPGPAPASRALGKRLLNTIIPAASAGENGESPVTVCLDLSADSVEVLIADCEGFTNRESTGNVPLGADGSFGGPVPPWTVSGQLGPASGTVILDGGVFVIPVVANAPCLEPPCNVMSSQTGI